MYQSCPKCHQNVIPIIHLHSLLGSDFVPPEYCNFCNFHTRQEPILYLDHLFIKHNQEFIKLLEDQHKESVQDFIDIKFRCKACGDTFDFKQKLVNHILDQHYQPSHNFSCNECSLQMSGAFELIHHLYNKHREYLYNELLTQKIQKASQQKSKSKK